MFYLSPISLPTWCRGCWHHPFHILWHGQGCWNERVWLQTALSRSCTSPWCRWMQTPCRILSMWAVQTTSEYGVHQWNLLDNQYPQLHKAYPIEFQHCAKPEHLQQLTFIRSKHTLENYCYKFSSWWRSVSPWNSVWQHKSDAILWCRNSFAVTSPTAVTDTQTVLQTSTWIRCKKVIVQDCTTAAVASIAGKYTSQLHRAWSCISLWVSM